MRGECYLLSICWNLFTFCSLPVMEHRGTSRKLTDGLGLTVKWRNSETVSLKYRIVIGQII